MNLKHYLQKDMIGANKILRQQIFQKYDLLYASLQRLYSHTRVTSIKLVKKRHNMCFKDSQPPNTSKTVKLLLPAY